MHTLALLQGDDMDSMTQEALTDTQVASQAVTIVRATAEPGVMSPIESDFHRTLALLQADDEARYAEAAALAVAEATAATNLIRSESREQVALLQRQHAAVAATDIVPEITPPIAVRC